MAYDRAKAVFYAHKWAYGRNPRYMNFTGLGGDCTNFISQCLHAGGARMNYTPTFGWYYNSSADRAPAWTGVQYLYNFLTGNKGVGPFAEEISMADIMPGDVIQLSFRRDIFSHTLLVVKTGSRPTLNSILIATHSDDSDYRPLSTYRALARRFLRIDCR
ncbi:MAG: amidase domain-containing protein [Christensenellales bacterium]|jgi:hypothetical protein